ncbi:MAG: type II secretion system protein [Planctomycetes bacterium]|nr:type II secretion system protein [Planctomycetota bacterium]
MRRGFSLIELVLVIIVIGMVAAIAVPRVSSGQSGKRLSAAEKRLVTEFESVSDLARAKGRTHTIQIHLSQSEFRVYEGSPGSLGPLVRTVPMSRSPYEVRFETTNITHPQGYLTVDGFGMYSANARVRIAAGSMTRTVDLVGPVMTSLKEAEESGGGGGGGLLGGLVNGLLGG